jgi:cell division septation protein DedD
MASLDGAPPPRLPAMRQPVALTATTPALASKSASAEGDIGEPEVPLKASLTLSNGKAKAVRYTGNFHVQVGAFMSEAEAENRLGMVQQRAVDLLAGHLPFTASFTKDDKEWYRARFAGFSKDDAQATCAAMKKRSLDCVVMTAD